MKTTMTAGRSSENVGRFAGGHFAGGHDGMANLCKPITAYDFHVRYNNMNCRLEIVHSLNASIIAPLSESTSELLFCISIKKWASMI